MLVNLFLNALVSSDDTFKCKCFECILHLLIGFEDFFASKYYVVLQRSSFLDVISKQDHLLSLEQNGLFYIETKLKIREPRKRQGFSNCTVMHVMEAYMYYEIPLHCNLEDSHSGQSREAVYLQLRFITKSKVLIHFSATHNVKKSRHLSPQRVFEQVRG